MLTRLQKKNLLDVYNDWLKYIKIIKNTKTIQKYWKIFDVRDPITLSRPIIRIKFVRGNTIHVYDAQSLFAYILHTGDFKDPITRTEFNTCELMRIDHKNKNRSRFLIEKKDVLLNMRTEEQLNDNLCNALENEFNDYIQQIRNNQEMSHEEFSTQMIPPIFQCYENYKSTNRSRCKSYLTNVSRALYVEPIDNLEIHIRVCHLIRILIVYCEQQVNIIM